MELVRIRDLTTAKVVSRGIKRYNGIHVGPRRVLRTPHFAIILDNRLAGWIGYHRDSRRKFEINHLSIRPRFRREGLAEEATVIILGLIWDLGCRVAYVRIKRGNRASVLLSKGMGFRRTGKGSVEIYTLKLKKRPVFTPDEEDTLEDEVPEASKGQNRQRKRKRSG